MPRKLLRPPIKLRKKYADLIVLCRNKILTAVPQTSGTIGDAMITVCVKWPTKQGAVKMMPDLPPDFPTGVVVERTDEWVTIRHSVVALLSYFKSAGYCNYNASDLFAMRLPIMMRLCKMELGLERMLEGIDADLQQVGREDNE